MERLPLRPALVVSILLLAGVSALNRIHAAGNLELAFSTYLGGDSWDQARDVEVDADGNIYVTGGSRSSNFPTTRGAPQLQLSGPPDAASIETIDAFLTKFSADGRIIWSTYIGGPNYDRAYAVESDDSGFVYIAGRAGRGFPVTPGALQTSFKGGTSASFYGPQDGFVCKLTAAAGAIVFCTYFGTSDPNIVRDIAVDPRGDLYVASAYASGQYDQAIASRFNNRPRSGPRDAVLAKIRGDGTAVLWATYIGGSEAESNENTVAVDGFGSPYMLLTTSSTDIVTTAGAFDRSYGGNSDLFIAKFTPDTGQLEWATYLGGSRGEGTETHEFVVDHDGNSYVAIATRSSDFPTTPGAFQRTLAGGDSDIAIAKLSADGSQLLGSTFVGGQGTDFSEGTAVDSAGQVYVVGSSTSGNFPVTSDAFQKQRAGTDDVVAIKLAPDFTRLAYATYLGGAGNDDHARAAATDSKGNFYLVGVTAGAGWPVANASQPREGSAAPVWDAFVAKFTPGEGAPPPPPPANRRQRRRPS